MLRRGPFQHLSLSQRPRFPVASGRRDAPRRKLCDECSHQRKRQETAAREATIVANATPREDSSCIRAGKDTSSKERNIKVKSRHQRSSSRCRRSFPYSVAESTETLYRHGYSYRQASAAFNTGVEGTFQNHRHPIKSIFEFF